MTALRENSSGFKAAGCESGLSAERAIAPDDELCLRPRLEKPVARSCAGYDIIDNERGFGAESKRLAENTTAGSDDGHGEAGRWVFGYGSLMWRPGFEYIERAPAVLRGLRRAFCIYSVHHRGTYERPGLVLGLTEGGLVRGVAYHVAEVQWPAVYAYLCEREQPTETYEESYVAVELADGRQVKALTFLSDHAHPQWAGNLDLDVQADLIAGASGQSGRNVDYLRDLVLHLREADAGDQDMETLLATVERLEADGR
jgi:cation transport protein ChaC